MATIISHYVSIFNTLNASNASLNNQPNQIDDLTWRTGNKLSSISTVDNHREYEQREEKIRYEKAMEEAKKRVIEEAKNRPVNYPHDGPWRASPAK